MSPIKLIDNALPPDIFHHLSQTILSPDWPWFFQETVVENSKEDPENKLSQFVYIFYRHYEWSADTKRLLLPLINILDPLALIKIKANLTVKQPTNCLSGFHSDLEYLPNQPDSLTAIYYVNATNGPTRFEDGNDIDSVANRLIIFPSHLRHSGTFCTDAKRRVVINFNYFPCQ